jgi:hypothetical protein
MFGADVWWTFGKFRTDEMPKNNRRSFMARCVTQEHEKCLTA